MSISWDPSDSANVVNSSLDMLEVDSMGLDILDRKLLRAIIEQFGGGPVGIDTLSSYIGEDGGTIEDVYEHYLIKIGYIIRTPRGRVVTKNVYEHLGIEYGE